MGVAERTSCRDDLAELGLVDAVAAAEA